jgi:FMN reductase
VNGLAGVVAIPLMLGAGASHALAPELLLKPVLVELGATCPTRGLYIVDAEYSKTSAYEPWLVAARAQVLAATSIREAS